MAVYVVIHARFHDAQWGIFRDGNLIALVGDSSKKISENALPLLEDLLNTHKISLSDLSFIAAHQGPAPFTTLRVCLSLINGIAFAIGIPLIGVNGLEALLEDYKQPDHPTIVLLNAFSKEVYYAFHDPKTGTTAFGCAEAASYIEMITREYTSPLTFLGNGAEMYRELIEKVCGNRATILPHDLVSLESIAQRALARWQHKETEHHLLPLYLKSSSAAMSGHGLPQNEHPR
jgi:tRNA threonylcarbamoyladenosine biosynthesis protein TsaB